MEVDLRFVDFKVCKNLEKVVVQQFYDKEKLPLSFNWISRLEYYFNPKIQSISECYTKRLYDDPLSFPWESVLTLELKIAPENPFEGIGKSNYKFKISSLDSACLQVS